MALIKPLTIEEVPEEARAVYVYSNQWSELVPAKTGRKKYRTMVEAVCPACNEYHAVPVNDVRNWIRGVRKAMPGIHRNCKYLGRRVTDEGYVWLWMPEHPNAMNKRYVQEHIYVMSKNLGRPLNTKTESVHHINGDKADNRIENLQLRKKYHGKGQAWECQDCGSHNIKAVQL